MRIDGTPPIFKNYSLKRFFHIVGKTVEWSSQVKKIPLRKLLPSVKASKKFLISERERDGIFSSLSLSSQTNNLV